MRSDNVGTGFPIIRLAAEQKNSSPAESHKNKLRELAGRLEQAHGLAKGQFVQWKPGLRNRNSPEYGEPAIVTAVLSTPVFDLSENSASSPYFQEPLSVVIGIYREDDLLEFRVDGRRFEPFDS